MQNVKLEVLVSPGCSHCHEFEEFWKTVEKDWPGVNHRAVDVTTPEGSELAQKYMIFSSPGIILNGELFSMGGFDRQKFIEKLKQVSQ